MSNTARRYPGLNYFTTEQKDQFFGRDDEREALLSLVQTEKIVVLFGKSGYGKSSLVRAGLIPDLDAEVLPTIVQLGAHQAGTSLTPVAQTLARLQIAVPNDAPDTAFLSKISATDTLWYHFRRKQSGKRPQFLLIFDQFEEFDSYPPEQKAAFKEQLHELLFTRIPQTVRDRSDDLPDAEQALLARNCEVKALFAIREDRLSVLQVLADKLPAILHKRYHLGGLKEEHAKAAIIRPARLPQGTHFESPAFEYSPLAITEIFKGLKKDDSEQLVESFLLQICCDDIETRIIERNRSGADDAGLLVVTEQDLPVFKDLFEKYYRNKIAALPDEATRHAARRMMEDSLVKADPASGINYRIPVDSRTLLTLPGVDVALLKRLTDAFLLRSEPNTTGGFSYEVSHDRLMNGILVMKKEYEETEAEKRREQERREAERRAREAEAQAAEERHRAEEAERLKNEAILSKQEAERQSAEAKAARTHAEEEKKKAQKMSFIAIGMAFLACIGLLAAGYGYDQAEKVKQVAVAKSEEAIAARNEAEAGIKALQQEKAKALESKGDSFSQNSEYSSAVYEYEAAFKLLPDDTVLLKKIAQCKEKLQIKH